ncbi:TolC family protein [Variovorax rhizosphaerae]|uniref:TolC family protein n=1 Tax=Variovorax rhizosphaerae TaxID=1836200 RepID=A0ABU8WIS3_9BURK
MLDEQKHKDRSAALISRMAADQEPVSAPVDLYNAMARAIKYNLDYRVEVMDQALRTKDLNLKRFDMLPKVMADLDYTGRSNDSGGFSRSLLTGRISLEPSTSSDRDVFAQDLTLSWDLLDFGLSYVRAQQAADEVMLSEERKRKVINRIVEDVRSAYWRAVSAQRLLTKITDLERVTQEALQQAEQQQSTGLTAPLSALSYQRELLSIRREAQTLARELSVAKQQLAALMNVPPETQFQVVLPPRNTPWQPVRMQNAEMLRMAIENRPELREVAYQMRSNDREGVAAILRTLPSLRVFIGADWSDNSYLYNNSWTGYGARASWNVLNVFRLPADRARVQAQNDLLDERAKALTMAVATQVQVSRARYEFRLRELDTAQRYLAVQGKIENQFDAGFKAEKLSRQTLIREQMNTVVSEVRLDVALADLQNAYANIYASIGIDPIDVSMSSSDSVEVLSNKLRTLWAQRDDALAATSIRR